jgi:hypothetical protein
MVDHLPSKNKALSSNSSIPPKKNQMNEIKKTMQNMKEEVIEILKSKK